MLSDTTPSGRYSSTNTAPLTPLTSIIILIVNYFSYYAFRYNTKWSSQFY